MQRGGEGWNLAWRLPDRTDMPTFHVLHALCTSAQTGTSADVMIVMRRAEGGEDLMLFIVGIVIALIAVVIILRMRVPGLVEDYPRRYEMTFMFQGRLAIPPWAIAFFAIAIALTTPPPTTPFMRPLTTLLVAAALGIAAIVFWMSGAMPRLRTSRPLAPVAPSGNRDHASAAITLGTYVRTIEKPNRREADDVLDLVRMDDDGGWQAPPRSA